MITLLVTITVLETHLVTFKNVTSDMMKLSQSEKGCYQYSVYQSTNNKCVFTFVETYADNVALDAHKETEHFKYWKKITTDLITDKAVEVIRELL